MKRVAVIERGLREYILGSLAGRGDVSLCCFAEWRPGGTDDGGVPVVPIDSLREQDYDILLIAVRENRWLSRLLTYLHERGIRRDVYALRLFTMDKRLAFLRDSGGGGCPFDMERVDEIPPDGKPYLVHLETHVCDHCNLNCRQCNNFSPFVKEPAFCDPARFERDMAGLGGLFSRIGRFFLLGGEPLLAPELCCDMIRIYRKYFPAGELRVLTNALLVRAMKPAFWECCRENGVIIHISLYPPVRPKVGEIERCLAGEHVPYLVHKEVSSFIKHWTLYPFEDSDYNNERCGSGGCHYLRDGLLAKCPDALLVGNMSGALGCAEQDLNSRDAILIEDGLDARAVIRRLDSPIDLCKRCTFRRSETKAWGQVEGAPDPGDWILPHRFEAEVAALGKKAADCQKKVSALTSENAGLRGERAALAKSLDAERRALSALRSEHDATCRAFGRMERSLSFRAGRAITWVPRKIRDLLC